MRRAAAPRLEAAAPAYVLDHTVRRLEGARLLLGGEPSRLLRLQPRAAAALDLLLRDGMGEQGPGLASQLDPAMEALLRRLVDSAIVHPVPVATPTRLAEVSVVIPVLDDPTRLDRLLAALDRTAVRIVSTQVIDMDQCRRSSWLTMAQLLPPPA